MNSAMGLIDSRTKEPEFRWSLLLAIAAWVVIVWGFGHFLTTPEAEIPPPVTVDARIVELPAPDPTPAVAVHQLAPTPMRVIPNHPRPQKDYHP